MKQPIVNTIEVIESLDEDRYIEFWQFKDLLNFFPAYSKMQAWILYAGYTGFRPIEISATTINMLYFQDREHPHVLNRITKTKRKYYLDPEGRVIATKIIRTKKRFIPIWVRDYLEEYIRQNWQTMANGYLFPNGKGHHLTSDAFIVYFSKLRKKLLQANPVKYSWANDVVATRIIKGKKVDIHRLSTYALRKSHATWYAMKLLDAGVSDVLLAVSHHMGHKQLNTTYRYVKNLIADRIDGISAIKPPDLNENIIGTESPTTEVDRIIQLLGQSAEIREAVAQFLSKLKN